MASSSSFNVNPDVNSNTTIITRESKRKKIRKMKQTNTNNQLQQHHQSLRKWKSSTTHQIYSKNLVKALRTRTSPSTARTLRHTADRVLATAAKGKTRWSRAMLTNNLKFKHKKSKRVKVTGNIRFKKPEVKRSSSALYRKARVLGRLVPGCRNVSFPNLLEETIDYIAALQMQIRAMNAITGRFTGSDRLGSNSS